MRVNQPTIDLIKRFEGFVPDAYMDRMANPPIVTIGYGTTSRAGVGIVPKMGMKVTQAEAEEYLRRAVEKFADQIEPGFQRNPNENQFGAFVSLAYNVGPGAVLKSTALRKWNAGDLAGVEAGFRMFNKAGKSVLNGLVRRREAEVELFRAPVQSEVLAAIKPLADHGTSPWLSIILALLAPFRSLFGARK